MSPEGRKRPSIEGSSIGGRILVVPVDAAGAPEARQCEETLSAMGHMVQRAGALRDARDLLTAGGHEVVVVAIGAGGARETRLKDFLGWARDQHPAVVVGVPPGTASRGIVAWGACVVAADPAEGLERGIGRALRVARAMRREARHDPAVSDLARQIGAGDASRQVIDLVSRAAPGSSPLLIIGEPGSGRQLVARAVHSHPGSPRREGPFVRAPLAALLPSDPEAMHEELVGTPSRPGLLELARGGTLFLDDIALAPDTMQAAILSMLEERDVTAAGIGTLVRIIAGASGDLEPAVGGGRMNSDLALRVGVLTIRIPPLRDRVGDIPVLAGTLIERFARRSGNPVLGLTPKAVALMQGYPWPGNIRELEDHLERAVRRSSGPGIGPEDLSELAHMAGGRARGRTEGTLDIELSLEDSLPLREVARRGAAAGEILAIRRAIQVTGGNITRAAQLLGVSRLHLQKRMKRYGLRERR